MKKILWCGGSHMGNLRSAMVKSKECSQLVEQYQSKFFPTAGGEVWPWYCAGGRLKELGESRVQFRASPDSLLPNGAANYGEIFNLDEFDHVIFFGQWFRPLQYLGLTNWFDDETPLSVEAETILFRNVILNPFVPGSGDKQIPNEPFTRFPRIVCDPSKIIVIPDPLPMSPPPEGTLTRPRDYRAHFSIYQKNIGRAKRYYGILENICSEVGVRYCFQPEKTFDPISMTTHPQYAAFPDEKIHMNTLFYIHALEKLREFLDK